MLGVCSVCPTPETGPRDALARFVDWAFDTQADVGLRLVFTSYSQEFPMFRKASTSRATQSRSSAPAMVEGLEQRQLLSASVLEWLSASRAALPPPLPPPPPPQLASALAAATHNACSHLLYRYSMMHPVCQNRR